jgi:preprotein translocase subunit YajC
MFLLFANAAEGQPPPGMDFFTQLLLFSPILLIFLWLMMRPQQRQEEKQRKMIDSLEKNDRVMTVGGIIGAVHLVDKEHNEIVLKVDDGNGTKIRFVLSAVLNVLPKEDRS